MHSAFRYFCRSATYDKIIKDAEKDLRELLSIPPSYKVIFLQGGGTGQFAAVPLNLCPKLKEMKADYLVTGELFRFCEPPQRKNIVLFYKLRL